MSQLAKDSPLAFAGMVAALVAFICNFFYISLWGGYVHIELSPVIDFRMLWRAVGDADSLLELLACAFLLVISLLRALVLLACFALPPLLIVRAIGCKREQKRSALICALAVKLVCSIVQGLIYVLASRRALDFFVCCAVVDGVALIAFSAAAKKSDGDNKVPVYVFAGLCAVVLVESVLGLLPLSIVLNAAAVIGYLALWGAATISLLVEVELPFAIGGRKGTHLKTPSSNANLNAVGTSQGADKNFEQMTLALKELKELLDEGVLSQEEFDECKRKLL